MQESKKASLLGSMWTKEELREKIANPDLAIALGLLFMISGILDSKPIGIGGAIVFGCGIIARAIKDTK